MQPHSNRPLPGGTSEMTDTESLYEDDSDYPQTAIPVDHSRRWLITIALFIVVVVIVLVFLMLRGFGSVLNTANRSSSGNQIVPVEDAKPVDGAISVWMAAGSDLQRALSAASVRTKGIVDMGAGKFVVTVPTGTEVEAARLLREVDGVYDAGRVYGDTPITP